MIKIKLEVNNSGKVYAPSFCPYKEPEVKESFHPSSDPSHPELCGAQLISTERFLVRPGLCCICKICTFVPDIEELPLTSPTLEEKEAFQEYLVQKNLKIAASLSGQQQYLMKQDRLPIAIFLSRGLYDDMTKEIISDERRRQSLLGYFLNEETILCHVLGCPVYLSKKLTKSNVQVVGEVEWK